VLKGVYDPRMSNAAGVGVAPPRRVDHLRPPRLVLGMGANSPLPSPSSLFQSSTPPVPSKKARRKKKAIDQAEALK
jgi:hypothetical protein